MNAFTFGAKRVFLGCVRATRKALAEFGLTAARFDLLSVLVTAGRYRQPQEVTQSDVRRALGVTAPVVTRMMQSLEKAGLVRRERAPVGDRRQIWVSLTRQGERCIRKARRVMLEAVKRRVLVAICFGRHGDADARFRHMDKLESYLSALRRRFGDRATLYYPWGHPDD